MTACENCRFWRPIKDSTTQGVCRKSEPALIGGRTVTKASDKCFQHHPKNRMGEGKFTR